VISNPKDTRTTLLDAALGCIRAQGYAATTVDDLCRAAGVSKGSFFHYFRSKEDLAVAAAAYWNESTGALFRAAPYQQISDPRARLLAYVDFRADLLQGTLPQFSCLLGTLVQEVYSSHPAIRQACREGIEGHAATLVETIAQAKARHAPDADWSAESLALFTQATIQGAFVLAKAQDSVEVAAQSIAHLRNYLSLLLPVPGSSPAERP
jgi:TetR/AcrR family transcriptional regulator, transcriptional repressor for nem operon